MTEGYKDGVLEQKPTLVNLQCDIDHPTQCMADMLHIIHEFGGVENLKGKKVAMTWAYSPSYGKPLSVPQGVIGLMTRFGMDVVLAHPEGYEVMPEVEEVADEERGSRRRLLQAHELHGRGLQGRGHRVSRRAGLPLPPWRSAPNLYAAGRHRRHQGPGEGAAGAERRAQGLVLHRGADERPPRTARRCTCTACPPTSTASPARTARWRPACSTATATPLYKEASFKPYIIAAMIFLAKTADPAAALKALEDRAQKRKFC